MVSGVAPAGQSGLLFQRLVQCLLVTAVLTAIVLLAAQHLKAFGDPALVGASLTATPTWRIACAVFCTAASYLLMTSYDALVLRSLGLTVPAKTIARAAFTSYAISHSLGFGALTGGAARLRIYRGAGLSNATVARIIVTAGCAFWGGVFAVAGLCLIAAGAPLDVGGIVVNPSQLRAAGIGLVGICGGVALFTSAKSRTNSHDTRSALLVLPTAAETFLLLGVAAVDLALAAGTLLILIPSLGLADFPQVYLVYAVAIIAGLVSHVPGGIGVFEAVVLAGLPGHSTAIAAALVAYRLVYYLLPLVVALAFNGWIELHGLRGVGRNIYAALRKVAEGISPYALGLVSFLGGMVLLFSGALPAAPERMRLLTELLPLPFIEVSHLAASLVGTALLLVAPALIARLHSGLRLARVLLLLGAAFSLAKGIDFEEAAVLLGIAGLLNLASGAFYRETARPLTLPNRGWLIAATLGVIASTVSGVFAYRHVSYAQELWWQFALYGDAPRFVRASFAAGILLATFSARALMSGPATAAGTAELPPEVFQRATACSGRSDAALALTGDKRFLIGANENCFLMFSARARTWAVMGDPVGPREAWKDLVWEVRRLSDRSNARLCFYQISEAMLPLIVELGMKPIKYGEEALIALPEFTLAGAKAKSLRNGRSRALREGLNLRLIDQSEVMSWLPILQTISDSWLARPGIGEKAFSLGRFDRAYLRHFDLAVVMMGEGAPVAFANIWRSGDGEELSVDLMRYVASAPPGTMDFLLLELMSWARLNGFRRFNLGLAPLSGIQGGKLAPAWARLAKLIFAARPISYNFQGLRRYKEKFQPDWTSRFVALPPGCAGLFAVFDLFLLINGWKMGRRLRPAGDRFGLPRLARSGVRFRNRVGRSPRSG